MHTCKSTQPRGDFSSNFSDRSCTIAAFSASSEQPHNPPTTPNGGSDEGNCCIITDNPRVATVLYREKPRLRVECAALDKIKRQVGERAGIENRPISCLPYTLIYAVGRSETPSPRETVGPALAAALEAADTGRRSIQGVNYDQSIAGDDCLGLPGGAIGTRLLNQVGPTYPLTKLIIAGYLQGPMVAYKVRF